MKSIPTIAKAFSAITIETLDTKGLIDEPGRRLDTAHDVVTANVTLALDDLMGEVIRQVTLERKQAQELRRRVKKDSPHRTDIIREQDVAIRHLDGVLARLKKVTA